MDTGMVLLHMHILTSNDINKDAMVGYLALAKEFGSLKVIETAKLPWAFRPYSWQSVEFSVDKSTGLVKLTTTTEGLEFCQHLIFNDQTNKFIKDKLVLTELNSTPSRAYFTSAVNKLVEV